MSAQRIFSSKKLLEHGRVLREWKEPRCGVAKREVLKEGRRRDYRVNKGRKEKGCKKEE